MATWFTADTHWHHANVISYSKRPFASVQEMDATLTANWNAVVRPGDTVYHLGDFCWGTAKDAERVFSQLNGQIFMIWGNHDAAAWGIRKRFAGHWDVKMVKVDGVMLWLSHYAHRVWPQMHYGTIHLHGHSHGALATVLNAPCLDVGTDCWGYRPISLEEILKATADRPFKARESRGTAEVDTGIENLRPSLLPFFSREDEPA